MSEFKTGHLSDDIRIAVLGTLALTFANSMDINQVDKVASVILTIHDDVAGKSKAEPKIWSETIAGLARRGSISKLAEVQRYSSADFSSSDLAFHLLELTLPPESLPFKALSEIVKWGFGDEESELHTYLLNNMRQQDGSDFLVAATATLSPENTIDLFRTPNYF